VLGSGCWVLGSGCWVLGSGFWVLGSGFWVLDAGCWVLGFGLGPGLYLLRLRRREYESIVRSVMAYGCYSMINFRYAQVFF